MSRINKLENSKDIEEIEKVSAIFAAILKSKSHFNNFRAGQTDSLVNGRSRCMNDFIVSVNGSKLNLKILNDSELTVDDENFNYELLPVCQHSLILKLNN